MSAAPMRASDRSDGGMLPANTLLANSTSRASLRPPSLTFCCGSSAYLISHNYKYVAAPDIS